ncbi:MAG TPA: 50S ribosomal protein L24 [Sphingobacteriaceae bacterium]|nr:50S ribosomal protein L24 [Sphingobacteriaceae bacterium]
MGLKIRTGDTVLVLTGKDRGKQGKVQKVLPRENRVIVEGVNIVKKHQRPTREMMQGGIVEQPAPLHISNVMLVCRRCNKPTRVAKKKMQDGSYRRACKRCGETIG